MVWEDALFDVLDDLEQQATALYDAERGLELADRARAEYRVVELAARLMATVGAEVGVDVLGAGRIDGVLERVAEQWCHVRAGSSDWLIALSGLGAVSGVSSRAVPSVAWSPLTRLTLAAMLRRLAEARVECVMHRVDGVRITGRIGRVGADFVELDQPVGQALVPLAALSAVQSR